MPVYRTYVNFSLKTEPQYLWNRPTNSWSATCSQTRSEFIESTENFEQNTNYKRVNRLYTAIFVINTITFMCYGIMVFPMFFITVMVVSEKYLSTDRQEDEGCQERWINIFLKWYPTAMLIPVCLFGIGMIICCSMTISTVKKNSRFQDSLANDINSCSDSTINSAFIEGESNLIIDTIWSIIITLLILAVINVVEFCILTFLRRK